MKTGTLSPKATPWYRRRRFYLFQPTNLQLLALTWIIQLLVGLGGIALYRLCACHRETPKELNLPAFPADACAPALLADRPGREE